jgi:TolB-like protein/DNA-binding SARP family transcriptional activator/Tfp pilus assembly protein PilF
MLSLNLLGGLQALLAEQPLAGRAAHRKRLALLALLASAPSRTMSRDKLSALLWSEYDTERSRHQVATALYDLRKAAGEELILSSGEDLRLSAASVSCDVWNFEMLLAAGEREQAVQCYAGPLLDGFFLPDAAEFERWIEGERGRLAQLYAGALEDLAWEAEATNDSVAAARWWRQLAVHDPYSSRVALGLMRALAAAGDAAAAIQFAGTHTALLREHLEVEPNSEVLALAEELRVGAPAFVRAAPGSETIALLGEADPKTEVTELSVATVPLLVDGTGTLGASSAPTSLPRRSNPRGRRAAWVAGALGLGALLLAGNLSFLPQRGGALPVVDQLSVPILAVLPLKNDTGHRDQEHFADAMTEALIAELARESGLRVISRTSVMPYKNPGNRRLPEIARELNADLIIEGSVFRAGDRVRITAQLIRASTDEHLWAETYEGDITDIIRLQNQVAVAVAGRVGVRHAVRERGAYQGDPGPVRPAAYEAYLRGRRSSGSEGIEALQRAIELDPDFAPAYAALADRFALAGFFGFMPPDSAFGSARRASRQALARDGNSAQAHGALGIVLLHYDWNWAEAEKHFRRALELSPSNAYLRHMFAHQLLAQGRTGESSRESDRAAELDPFNASMIACAGWHGLADGQSQHAASESLRALHIQPEFFWPEMILGWSFERQGRYREAIAVLKDAVSHSGGSSFALAAQAHAHAVAGEETKAKAILIELHRRSQTSYVSAYDIATVYAGLRENDEALRWLEQAYQERSSFLINIGWEPRFRGLHSNAQFRSLARRLGIPLQQAEG